MGICKNIEQLGTFDYLSRTSIIRWEQPSPNTTHIAKLKKKLVKTNGNVAGSRKAFDYERSSIQYYIGDSHVRWGSSSAGAMSTTRLGNNCTGVCVSLLYHQRLLSVKKIEWIFVVSAHFFFFCQYDGRLQSVKPSKQTYMLLSFVFLSFFFRRCWKRD